MKTKKEIEDEIKKLEDAKNRSVTNISKEELQAAIDYLNWVIK